MQARPLWGCRKSTSEGSPPEGPWPDRTRRHGKGESRSYPLQSAASRRRSEPWFAVVVCGKRRDRRKASIALVRRARESNKSDGTRWLLGLQRLVERVLAGFPASESSNSAPVTRRNEGLFAQQGARGEHELFIPEGKCKLSPTQVGESPIEFALKESLSRPKPARKSPSSGA